MPNYEYQCQRCDFVQEQYKSIKDIDPIDTISKDLVCSNCSAEKNMKRIISTSIQTIDHSRIRLNGDPKKEAEYEKRSKDPERARQLRRKKFGTDGISITKSPYYHKEKKIKAQGKSDVSKKDFIQQAAKNPNALAAARKIVNK